MIQNCQAFCNASNHTNNIMYMQSNPLERKMVFSSPTEEAMLNRFTNKNNQFFLVFMQHIIELLDTFYTGEQLERSSLAYCKHKAYCYQVVSSLYKHFIKPRFLTIPVD